LSAHEEASLERIQAALVQLEPQALEVVAMIAERLVVGRKRYGDLDVRDGRNWSEELQAELMDGSVYACCWLLANTRR
jgi:hypothetical protein